MRTMIQSGAHLKRHAIHIAVFSLLIASTLAPLKVALASVLYVQTSGTGSVACTSDGNTGKYPEFTLTGIVGGASFGAVSMLASASTTGSVTLNVYRNPPAGGAMTATATVTTVPTVVTWDFSAYATTTATGDVWKIAPYGLNVSPYIMQVWGYTSSTSMSSLWTQTVSSQGSAGCENKMGSAYLQIGTEGAVTAFNPLVPSDAGVLPECSITDIGACMSRAFAWAFYPSVSLSERAQQIASTTQGTIPFGYLWAFSDKMDEYAAYSTSSLSRSVELSGVMNFLGATYSSTSMTVLSGSGLRSTLGTTMWNLTQSIFMACLWVGFLLYVYRRAIHLL